MILTLFKIGSSIFNDKLYCFKSVHVWAANANQTALSECVGGFIINYDQVVPKWANIAIVYTPTNLHINTHLTQVYSTCRDSAEEKVL